MIESQRVINELIETLKKIEAVAYYHGSCGIRECDKIEIMCNKAIIKYEVYAVDPNKQE